MGTRIAVVALSEQGLQVARALVLLAIGTSFWYKTQLFFDPGFKFTSGLEIQELTEPFF